ncbi:MAG: hypothetical protein US51_C0042G0002 [Microgenomates group bacterium GW2011_GWA2_37_6]|nr:MAG: hypothetical protein US51_C0042G0002 [Microgenomates group bacterium GW2011_GWA2_37_6]
MGTQNHEGDPTKRVVDIDSFVAYLAGYRSDVVATRPSSWVKHPDLHALANPDRPRISVNIYGISWSDTPLSIQQALSLQYPSASLDEEKSINLWFKIPKGHLTFELSSASVVDGFRYETGGDKERYDARSYDRHGKVVVPGDGLLLLLRDTPAGPKGNWVISQRPASASEIKFVNSDIFKSEWNEAQEGELIEAMIKMEKGSRGKKTRDFRRPATLQELQDIVAILERGVGNAAWLESVAPVALDSYATA